MSKFTIHNLETVPAESKAMLEQSNKAFGMVPNLHGVLAESPNTFEAYQVLHKLFSESSFNAEELTVVWQTINVEHGCTYCVPAHTAIADMMKVDSALSDALRNREAMPTAKLQALHDTTLLMVRKRGMLSDAEMEAFFAAGYGQQQLLEIILGLSQKVISNYVNHIAHTPTDAPFQKFAWEDNK
ncbi:carboxymuconolactone decarboxylase family protein [Shewanella olleyana]|uniref:carboxymuconolactone decarboxylase family protein n=1 Tax=Shewanella olleyana TaxID=135626 RepID=UPI0020107FCC|nr:carboxymuconolactone decarboxylase family protein [Shewanella olleyana]MCL1067539.1 carboxymuconolactone decarboxylase family protein [Shewanella olleyana]